MQKIDLKGRFHVFCQRHRAPCAPHPAARFLQDVSRLPQTDFRALQRALRRVFDAEWRRQHIARIVHRVLCFASFARCGLHLAARIPRHGLRIASKAKRITIVVGCDVSQVLRVAQIGDCLLRRVARFVCCAAWHLLDALRPTG